MCQDAGKTNRLLFIAKKRLFLRFKGMCKVFCTFFVVMSFCECSGVAEAQGSCHNLDNLSRSLRM